MPNNADTVAQIRSLLSGTDLRRTPRMETLARDYAGACQAVSDRLNRCLDFLNRGLRGEAVHHARTSPDLFDSLGQLEFIDRDQWDAITVGYGLPNATRPNPNAAIALNRAFAEHAPLQPLLARSRRLALEQAPVGERLQVLQELMSRDASNPLWSDSIGDFERARCQELERDVADARRRGDSAALVELQRELTSGWTVHKPSPALLAQVQTSLRSMTLVQQITQLERLANQIVAAYSARQPDQVMELLSQWDEHAARLQGDLPRNLKNRVAPMLAWRQKELSRQAEDQAFQGSSR